MRISDWSSDVCSSDLGGVERLEVGICPADLLADDEAWRAGTGIDVEFDDPDRDVPTDLIEALAKLRDRPVFGRRDRQFAAPFRIGTLLSGLLDGPRLQGKSDVRRVGQ